MKEYQEQSENSGDFPTMIEGLSVSKEKEIDIEAHEKWVEEKTTALLEALNRPNQLLLRKFARFLESEDIAALDEDGQEELSAEDVGDLVEKYADSEKWRGDMARLLDIAEQHQGRAIRIKYAAAAESIRQILFT